MLIYQTFDATFVSLLAAGIYVKAHLLDEVMKVNGDKGNTRTESA